MAILVGLLMVFGLIVVGGLICSLPVMWLWNGLLPELFHFPEITWLQAWGLLILCGLLFKSSTSTSSK